MKHSNILILSITITGSIMLIGHSLDLKALGGNGFIKYPNIYLDNQSLQRGATFTFDEQEVIAPYEHVVIEGEKGSQILFQDTRPDTFSIALTTGRIQVQGKVTVWTNRLLFLVDGEGEIIHYSWRNEAEMTARTGSVTYDYPGFYLPHPVLAPAHGLFPTDAPAKEEGWD